jgi:cobalt-zinc-cadmium efflux system protein
MSDSHGHDHHGHEHGHHGHDHPHGHAHHGPNLQVYLIVFVALCVFTISSFIVNAATRSGSLPPETGFALILGVAIVKAILVGLIFMHLKYDWGRLFFIIIPVSIMGVLLVVVLLPDILLAWHIDN